ncbi:Spy/CpxP family protein refolding chaperone [bacterium]|nr:Spy/CpxP family protein refolding chaperone [bacterium]
MKRALLLIISGILIAFCPSVYAEEEISIETEVTTAAIVQGDFSSQLVEKIKAERNTIYNALNLTPEQIQKKDEIEKKRYEALEPELKNLCLSRKKLKDLETTKSADTKTINAAQKEVNSARKEIKSISNKYDKEFKKILTSAQKSKYNMIRKLKRADLKKLEQKNTKKPDLRPFGVPISQAEYAQQKKHPKKSKKQTNVQQETVKSN